MIPSFQGCDKVCHVNEAKQEIRARLDLPEAGIPVGTPCETVAACDGISAGHRRQPVHDTVQPLQHRLRPDAARRCDPTSPYRRGEEPARTRVGYFAHSPLRNTGTLLPSAKMPSMSVSPEPIIQSIWIRL